MRHSRAFLAVTILFSATASAQTQYEDGDFFGFNWLSVKIEDSTPGGAATFSVVRRLVGGNPGAFREVTHTFGHGTILVGHRKLSAVYDPAVEGPIEAVLFEFALKSIEANVAYGPFLVQDGHYYRSYVTGTPADWTHVEFGPLYTDCWGVNGDGPVLPNFSASGGPITFGYLTANTTASDPISTVSGLDNWRVTVNPPPVVCPSDLNRDGVVDIADLSQMLSRFGEQDLNAGEGSLDCDRDIDITDLALFLSAFGTICP